ncbi:MAG: hypothetical protein H6626_06795 [Pseudobdellovibrionaceae bacterium]|nr:hypothetical protein [Bdellovibrionales bacterium]USN48791.1 MAG: hypothetical protein H6626_06795 [Pseudobdellovibrionaceae bacterium]
MKNEYLSTTRKALTINLDNIRYGTFAEIGAGQEVARHFFQAGHASNTVAKTISAYDKVFSDAIYGKGSRFVSHQRLNKMLDHEYKLLEERLKDTRGSDSCFFVFANTVATSSHQEDSSSHAWAGVRFQTRPGGPTNDVILHVNMHDRMRLQQQEALGILGVNLLFGSFYLSEMGPDFVASLIENLGFDRVEIDFIRFMGEDVDHIDDRILSLELVKQGLTKAVMFQPNGEPQQLTDALYGKSVLVERGAFRPLTMTNLEIITRGKDQVIKDCRIKEKDLITLFEITMKHLKQEGHIDYQDFLQRVDTICALGYPVLVTNYPLYSQLNRYLRRCTHEHIAIIVGAASLPALFSEDAYKQSRGGILGAFGDLFDDNSRIYVYPFKNKDTCSTAASFFPDEKLQPLYQYLRENKSVLDILDCDDVDTSVSASDVRKMMEKGDSRWEQYVPDKVCKLIKSRKLFGYHEF